MSAPQFTRGPWIVAGTHSALPEWFDVLDSDGRTKPYTLVARTKTEADASLVAAAPTLLGALQRAYDHVLKDAGKWFEDGSFEQKAMQLEAERVLSVLLSVSGGEA